MNEYTAEDFKNAEVAVKGHANVARRADPGSEFSWLMLGGSWTTDSHMALDGWRPVRERDEDEIQILRDLVQANRDNFELAKETLADIREKNRTLMEAAKLREAAPLTLGTLREAWENAEVTTECHIGDWIIGWLPEHKHFTFHEATCESRSLPPESRVYRRAPEPWQALGAVLNEVGANIQESVIRMLHERGVRVTGGDAA